MYVRVAAHRPPPRACAACPLRRSTEASSEHTPAWSNAVKSAGLEAARSSSRGIRGWALNGTASRPGCLELLRAVSRVSRSAGAELRHCPGCTLTMRVGRRQASAQQLSSQRQRRVPHGLVDAPGRIRKGLGPLLRLGLRVLWEARRRHAAPRGRRLLRGRRLPVIELWLFRSRIRRSQHDAASLSAHGRRRDTPAAPATVRTRCREQHRGRTHSAWGAFGGGLGRKSGTIFRLLDSLQSDLEDQRRVGRDVLA